MFCILIRSNLSYEDLISKAKRLDALIIKPSIVSSFEVLYLCEYLTQKSFKANKNIAKDFKLEFLLWLTAKTDIKSSLLLSKPTNSELLVIAFSGQEKKILFELSASKRFLSFKQSDPIKLENISLSRII